MNPIRKQLTAQDLKNLVRRNRSVLFTDFMIEEYALAIEKSPRHSKNQFTKQLGNDLRLSKKNAQWLTEMLLKLPVNAYRLLKDYRNGTKHLAQIVD